MKWPFVIFIICNAVILNGQQSSCPGSNEPYYLHSNNIRASFIPRGNKFSNEQLEGQFLVPFNVDSTTYSIYASSPWIGGLDDAGNLKIAVETYPPLDNDLKDFSVGPLNSIGLLYDSTCTHYDRAWSVYREEIEAHNADFYMDFKIDDTIESIFKWPGKGNKHFEKYYGFALPDNYYLAPFRDINSNDIYDPENGDFPVLFPHSTTDYIPDQILWMIFNDLSPNDTNPLRFEVQLTAFSYYCEENTWLNNTIFNMYKIVNRSISAIDSVYFGMWTDYDLGCYADDFVGSDSLRNTEFVYNDVDGDGYPGLECSGQQESYGSNPPLQSLTYLSHPMHSFIQAKNENEPIDYYRKLIGRWEDNTRIYPTGEGFDPDSLLPPTNFLFHGDPRNSNSWSAKNVLSKGKDYKTVSSVKLGRMDPGSTEVVLMAYQFHHHPDSNYNGQISLMFQNIDSLRSESYLGESCTPFTYCMGEDCVWPGDFNNDGIADQFDLLHWGVMQGENGSTRRGIVNWRSQHAENWAIGTPDGIDYKHGDADGNGMITRSDLKVNELNFLKTNDLHQPSNSYPEGPEFIISASPIDNAGGIRNLMVKTNMAIDNVMGLAYEWEIDTSLFQLNRMLNFSPEDSNYLFYSDQQYEETSPLLLESNRFAFVTTDHSGIDLAEGFVIQRNWPPGISLKPGLSISDIPDSTFIRLRNLIAIDRSGNNLHVGSNQLVVYKSNITALEKINGETLTVYPNPADDKLFIDYPKDIEGVLINMQGQILGRISSKNSDVSQYPPGIYFLNFPEITKRLKVIIN